MTNVRGLYRSFAGGEITPEMYGRSDLGQFQTALGKCRNFITLPHGPASNRPGTAYVLETKYSDRASRLIPFSYSTTQTMVLEFGDLYVRFHTQGGTLLEANKTVTAITQANPGVVTSAGHGYSNGQWVQLGTVAGMTDLSGRFVKVAGVTTNTFQLHDLAGNNIDTSAMPAFTGTTTVARVYEVVTPYTAAEVFDLHYTESADVLTLVHQAHPPKELRRLGATNWQLTAIYLGPTLSPMPNNAPPLVVGSGSGSANKYRYAVTIVNPQTNDESLIRDAYQTKATLNHATVANPCVFTTTVAHGFTAGQILDSVDLTVAISLGGNAAPSEYFTVDTVPSGTTLTIKDSNGVVINGLFQGAGFFTSVNAGIDRVYQVEVVNDLAVGGAKNTLTWTRSVFDAGYNYNVYAYSRGLWGFIGTTADPSFVDNNITPDISRAPPMYQSPPIMSAANDYPGAVAYFEQRRVFAGSINQPQNVWMTRSGTESDTTYTIPSRDDNAITFRVAARESNTIRHLVPMSDLLMLTSAGEWRVTSISSDAITPTSISVRPQGYVGANNVQPVVAGNALLYAQARGGRMREMVYSYSSNGMSSVVSGYMSNDISILAPHLFDYATIVDMALMRSPWQILWCVSSNGKLLGMTYIPEQKVLGWHQHDTDGSFESVAVVTEADDDVLYTVVNRTVNGRQVRYIERMASRLVQQLEESFFVDCGEMYQGAPATTLSGLQYLEGKTVSILADGAVFAQQIVTDGKITLEKAASTVVVGLPITADMQTLPFVYEQLPAAAQGRQKNVSKVFLRVNESSSVQAGAKVDDLTQYKQRDAEPFGTPPALINAEIEITVFPSWNSDGAIIVRQTDPLPLTICAMCLEVSVGG